MGTIIGNFLRSIFGGLTKEIKKLTPEIIQIVTNLKNFVDSPGCDLITSVIPGTLDDKIQDILKSLLPKLLILLGKVESKIDSFTLSDENEQSKAALKVIQESDPDVRDILLHGIASKLIQATTGMEWGKSTIVAEATYQDPEVLK